MTGADAIALLVLLTILIAIAVYLLHWLYRHSTKDQSFVRTGLGGERVIIGGGAFVIPIVHNITRVNMNAMPVEIRRIGEQSLITLNKMRIDIVAEFFVRVVPTAEGVSIAARTLGDRTQNALELKDIVQGRFADAMASVAATMTMEEIHANRGQFIAHVAQIAAATLDTNGLELENASLTSLNQSDISVFNPANAFDAEGLTQLTQQIEDRRKLRSVIENDARIAIKTKDYEAERRAIEIDRDLEYARIEQASAIEAKRAAELARIEDERSNSAITIQNAKVRAEQEAERVRIAKDKLVDAERVNSTNEVRALEIERNKTTELTDILSRRELDALRIQAQQDVEAERIQHERRVREFSIRSRQDIAVLEALAHAQVEQAKLEREREVEASRIETTKAVELLAIEKEQRLKLAETSSFRKVEDASIAANREVEELRIAAKKYIDRFEIEHQRDVEIVDKERLIAVVTKSIEEASARTEAARALKDQAATEEQIKSVREEEIAARAKRIELIQSSARTEREAQRLVALAKAEKEAIELRAAADVAEAEAAEVRYAKDAEGRRLLNESENMRSEASRRSAILEDLVRNLPNIIRETVKPMENIDSIKILQVDGLPGLNSPSETGGADGGGGGGGGNMTDRVVNSALKYRTQVAFVDGLLKDLGLPVEKLGGAGGMSFRNFQVPDKLDGGED